MENIFQIGNKITTNRTNIFEILDVNHTQIVCKDTLTEDFIIFDKTEHDFEIANIKIIFEMVLQEVLDDVVSCEKDKIYILEQMCYRFKKWL